MNLDELKKVVVDVAKLLNIASKVVHNQGLLGALWDAGPIVKELTSADFNLVKQEIAALSPEDRLVVEKAFKDALVLVNPQVEAKIEGMVDLLDQGVGIAAEGADVAKKGQDLLNKIKALLA